MLGGGLVFALLVHWCLWAGADHIRRVRQLLGARIVLASLSAGGLLFLESLPHPLFLSKAPSGKDKLFHVEGEPLLKGI